MNIEDLIKENVRNIPDFPIKGINFKDITTLLKNTNISKEIIENLKQRVSDLRIDAVVGIESRGFLYGFALAQALDLPFIIIRKKGKLPYKTISHSYKLEYGEATIEMHSDALEKNWNVLVHDDLLATGGTAAAAAELIKKADAKVASFCFIINLDFLNGKEVLKKYSSNLISLANYN